MNPDIPLKANRPPDPRAWFAESYQDQNCVERLSGRAKQFRRVATRYYKLKATVLGFLNLAFGFIHLRRLTVVIRL